MASLSEALEPQVVVLAVPSEGPILRRASAETSVVAKPSAWGEVATGIAYDALVRQERECAGGIVSDQDGYVHIPRLHPGGQVADRAPIRVFLLRNNHFAVRGGVLRKSQRERWGGARAVPRREQCIRQQGIKVNELTSQDPLTYLGRYWWLAGWCWERGV